jgi:hypothetical protein
MGIRFSDDRCGAECYFAHDFDELFQKFVNSWNSSFNITKNADTLPLKEPPWIKAGTIKPAVHVGQSVCK